MNFLLFLQNRQKVKNSSFIPKTDAEFEKDVFLHVGLDLTIKKLILN